MFYHYCFPLITKCQQVQHDITHLSFSWKEFDVNNFRLNLIKIRMSPFLWQHKRKKRSLFVWHLISLTWICHDWCTESCWQLLQHWLERTLDDDSAPNKRIGVPESMSHEEWTTGTHPTSALSTQTFVDVISSGTGYIPYVAPSICIWTENFRLYLTAPPIIMYYSEKDCVTDVLRHYCTLWKKKGNFILPQFLSYLYLLCLFNNDSERDSDVACSNQVNKYQAG